MRVLFVDDEKYRHDLAWEKHFDGPVDMTHAWSAKAAIDWLQKSDPFDLVMLDHDLGAERQRQDVSDCREDGCAVARFIASMPPDRRPKTVITHSFNEAGRNEIAAICREAGIRGMKAPFGTFKVSA